MYQPTRLTQQPATPTSDGGHRSTRPPTSAHRHGDPTPLPAAGPFSRSGTPPPTPTSAAQQRGGGQRENGGRPSTAPHNGHEGGHSSGSSAGLTVTIPSSGAASHHGASAAAGRRSTSRGGSEPGTPSAQQEFSPPGSGSGVDMGYRSLEAHAVRKRLDELSRKSQVAVAALHEILTEVHTLCALSGHGADCDTVVRRPVVAATAFTASAQVGLRTVAQTVERSFAAMERALGEQRLGVSGYGGAQGSGFNRAPLDPAEEAGNVLSDAAATYFAFLGDLMSHLSAVLKGPPSSSRAPNGASEPSAPGARRTALAPSGSGAFQSSASDVAASGPGATPWGRSSVASAHGAQPLGLSQASDSAAPGQPSHLAPRMVSPGSLRRAPARLGPQKVEVAPAAHPPPQTAGKPLASRGPQGSALHPQHRQRDEVFG